MKRKSISPSNNARGSVATNVTAASLEVDTSADSGYEVEGINININDQRALSKSRTPSQVTKKTLVEEQENKDDIQDDSNQPINLWKKPAFTPLLPPIEECPPECPNKSLIPKCSKCFQPLKRPIGRCNCKQLLPTCESSCQHYPAMVSKSVFPCNELSTQTCSSPVCRPLPYDSPNCRNTQTFPPPDFSTCFDNSCHPSAPMAPMKRHKCVQTRGPDDFSVNLGLDGPGMKRDCCVSTSDNVPKTSTFGTNYHQDFDYNVKPEVENLCCKCTNFPEQIDQISLASGRESRRTNFKEDDKSQISRRTTFLEDPGSRIVPQSDEKESQCTRHCRFLVPTKYMCQDCGREHEPMKSAFDSQPACNCGVGPDSPVLSPKCNFCEVPMPLKCNCGMQKGNNPLSQQCSCGIESQQQPSTPQLQPQSPQLQPQQQLLYPALSATQPNFTQQPPMMNNQSFFPGAFKSFASQNMAQPSFQNKHTAYEPPKYFIVNQFSCTYNNEDDKIAEIEPSECSCGDYDVKCSKDCCKYALRTPPYFTHNPITVDQSTSIGILNNTQEEQSFRFFHFEYNVNKSENSCYCSDNIKCSSNCIRNRTNKSTQFGKLLRLNVDNCSCDESVKCSAECIKYHQDKNPVTYQHKSNQYSLPTTDNFEKSKLNTLLNNIVSNLKDNSFKTTSNSILKCTKHKYNREFDLRSSNLESIEEESMSYELAPENSSSAHHLIRCTDKYSSANDLNNNTKSIKQPKTNSKQFDIDKCNCKDTTKCTSRCVRNKMQLNKNCNAPEKIEQYKCLNRSKLESALAVNSLDKNPQEGPNDAFTKQLFERKQFDPTKYIPKCDNYVYRTNLPTCYHTETSFGFNESPEDSYCDNDAYQNCQTDCDIERCCSFCNHLNLSHNSNQCCIEDNPCVSDENANYSTSCCPECDNVSDNAQYFSSHHQAELFCSPECDIYTQNQASSNEFYTPQNTCKKCFKFSDTCDEDTPRLNNSKYRTNSTEPIKTQTNSENEMIRICRECCERNKNVIDTALKKERQEEVGEMRSRTSFEYESCSVMAKENGSHRREDVCPNVKFCDKNPLDISESEMEILISSYVPRSKQERTSGTSSKDANGNFGEPKYHYLMTDSSTGKPYSFEKPDSNLTVNVSRKGSSRVSKTSKIARSSKTNATKIALEANKRLVLDEQQKNAPVINRKLSPPYEDDDNRSDSNFPYKEDAIDNDDDDDKSLLMQEDSSIKKGEINRKNIPSLFEDVVKERRKTVALQPTVLVTESRPNKDEKKSHKWFKCFKKRKKNVENKETLSVDQSKQFTEIEDFKKRENSESDQFLGQIGSENVDENNTEGINYRRRESPIKTPISEKDKVLNRYLDNLSAGRYQDHKK